MFRRLGLTFTFVLVTVTNATTPPDPALECSGENIVYDPCPKDRLIYCDDLMNPPACGENEPCKPRCRCADGYLINHDQKCIAIGDCLRCTGQNEFFSCGIPCDRACNNLAVECDGGSDVCTERCYCRDGYARDEHDICILIDECKFPACKDPNAVYTQCRRCVGNCDNREVSCSAACLPGCSCKFGYVGMSKKNDTCIKESLCPKDKRCPGKNQYFSSCVDLCPERCPTRYGGTACPSVSAWCRSGCQCIPGYIRNKNECVLPEDCPPFVCDLNPNEVYSKCGEKCRQTCASVLNQEPAICKIQERCYPECICKQEYVRDAAGRCALQKKCSSCKGANEEYWECGPFCESTCENPFPTCNNTSCKSGCLCRYGYIRKCGKCVPVTDCPAQNLL